MSCVIDSPDECYECGRFAGEGEVFGEMIIEIADPETGPRPGDIQDVSVCPECGAKPENRKFYRTRIDDYPEGPAL